MVNDPDMQPILHILTGAGWLHIVWLCSSLQPATAQPHWASPAWCSSRVRAASGGVRVCAWLQTWLAGTCLHHYLLQSSLRRSVWSATCSTAASGDGGKVPVGLSCSHGPRMHLSICPNLPSVGNRWASQYSWLCCWQRAAYGHRMRVFLTVLAVCESCWAAVLASETPEYLSPAWQPHPEESCTARDCVQVWKEQIARRAAEPPSSFHAAVSAALTSMHVAHACNAGVGHGIFLADILTEKPQLVLMVDGPASFTVNTCRPLGERFEPSHPCSDMHACKLQCGGGAQHLPG